jgi:ubiquitin-conjugating enzyme E2 D/E
MFGFEWTPALYLSKMLLSILSLLQDPFFDQSLMPDIAYLYIRDRTEFDKRAREYTENYA